MILSGKVALVTGGARRVGKVLSLALARSGADVVVNYKDSENDAAATVDAIRSFRRRAIAVRADVANLNDIRQMMDAITREFGRLDIVVNNAATFSRKPFLEIDEGEWDHVLGVN